jgi:hypothetical protein
VSDMHRDDQLAHREVLMEAYEIMLSRSEKYGDNWRNQGARGNLFKLRWKVERAWRQLWHREEEYALADVDDLLDAINDAVFAIRCVREGSRDGRWQW